MSGTFGSLALILGAAAAGGIAARALRQPAILGYVAAGMILAATGGLQSVHVSETLELMGQLGVTLLLFLVGLELPMSELRKMGRVALATGIGQIVFTSAAGFVIIRALGYPPIGAVYLSVALAFSSTIIVVKLLSEKRELQSLHGKIAVGFLLVQDFVAIGLMVVLSGLSMGEFSWGRLIMVGIKGVALVSAALALAAWVTPRVMGWLARSPELVFVGSIAWCLLAAAFAVSPAVGFGVEIGGFLAGLAMASAPEHLQILSRVKPLRDFFLTLFFVWLGQGLGLDNLKGLGAHAAVLSVFVLVGNPLIVMIIMAMMGYRKRISFLAGLTVAQISEFSLILMAMAYKVGYATEQMLALTTMVGVVTMTVSTYMITYGDFLYRKLSRYLGVFERKGAGRISSEAKDTAKRDHILLFGHNRTGGVLRPELEKLGEVVVVDFNPSVIEKLRACGLSPVYGDMADYELYDEVGLDSARLVVSTVPDIQDNLQLLERLKVREQQTVVMVADDAADAERLYAAGADLVIVPQRLGGRYLAEVFERAGLSRERIIMEAKKIRGHEKGD